MDYTPEQKPNYWLASGLADCMKAESDLLAKYEEMLGRLDPEVDKKIMSSVTEFVSATKARISLLSEMTKANDKIKINRTVKG